MATLYDIKTSRMPSASTLNLAFMKPEWGRRAWPVEVVTLDGVVSDQRLTRVELMKADTEGAEADVLGGMQRTLHRAAGEAGYCG